ncbi:MAG: class I SAM-dependent rRNA methyltransferase [Candidatus Lloydbacteria bacterium]|nr:class I SAM-dependent rRNA methyltransferase [Candidatus Lloydbacteria bacterium]
MENILQMLITKNWSEYALLDSGAGRKLERFGKYMIDRPEQQAMWSKKLPAQEWQEADAIFTGEDERESGSWRFRGEPLTMWETSYASVKFLGRITSFRHLGFFPEQASHWDLIVKRVSKIKNAKVLNLFAYTGVASLFAAQADAEVTHVDASKKAIEWAKENQKLSGLESAPVRFMCDDVKKFVAREIRRGQKYDVILLDPPKFGRGPKNEVWNFFDDLPELLCDCRALLREDSEGFLMLTSYALRASSLSLHQLCAEIFADMKPNVSSGELVLQEENEGRVISIAQFCDVDFGKEK